MGAVRISMVDLDTVTKFLPKKRETLSECNAAESAYLAGMRDVLQEVATRRFLELLGPCTTNASIIKAAEASIDAYNRLHDVLDEEKQKLLGLIEETFNFERALAEEEWFVRGFLEGCRFIKELHRSGGGVTLTWNCLETG